MRRFAVLGSVAVLALLVAGIGSPAPVRTTLTGTCAKANLDLVAAGKLSLATDNLSFPPWWGGKEGHGFKTSDPYSGKGYEGAVAYEVAKRLGFSKTEVTWQPLGSTQGVRAGEEVVSTSTSRRSRTSPCARRRSTSRLSYYDVNQAVVGHQGDADHEGEDRRGPQDVHARRAASARRATTTSSSTSSRARSPRSTTRSTTAITALKNKQIDGFVVDFPSTGYITAVQLPTSTVVGRLPNEGRAGALRARLPEGLVARRRA